MTRKKDPRFPDRPDTEEFWALSKIIIDLDEEAEGISPFGLLLGIDPDTVYYVAWQRELRMEQHSMRPFSDVAATALWVDGFTIGLRYGQRYGQQSLAIDDSTNTSESTSED